MHDQDNPLKQRPLRMTHIFLCVILRHRLHNLHYHRLHLLLFAQYFILNSRPGSSANPFFHRPFPFLPDWLHGLSDHLSLGIWSIAAAYSRNSGLYRCGTSLVSMTDIDSPRSKHILNASPYLSEGVGSILNAHCKCPGSWSWWQRQCSHSCCFYELLDGRRVRFVWQRATYLCFNFV